MDTRRAEQATLLPEAPPRNRAIGWLRLVVWSTPVGLAVVLVFVLYLLPTLDLPPWAGALLLIFLTAVVGWFDFQLKRTKWRRREDMIRHVLLFLFCQAIIVPAVLGGLAVILYLSGRIPDQP